MVSQPQFGTTETWKLDDMTAFMKRPDIYWSASDALAPSPDQMDFTPHLLNPYVWTIGATYDGDIIGYVQFVKRTSIGAEIHAGFHPQFRGKIAKAFVLNGVARAFKEKGLLKLWAIMPSDNRAAILMSKACGFSFEGRLTKAIVRQVEAGSGPPLRDLVIFGLSKEQLQ